MPEEITCPVRWLTLEDLDDLVDLHFSCYTAETHLAVVLGRPFIRDLYRWLVTSDRAISLGVDEDRKLIGFVTIYNGPYHQVMFSRNKARTALAFLCRPWVIFHPQILKRAFRAFFKSGEHVEVLESDEEVAHCTLIGIRPEHRRGGVAHAMMERVLEECRVRRWRKLRAIIYKENTASRRMMDKLGFEEEDYSEDKVMSTMDLPGHAQ